MHEPMPLPYAAVIACGALLHSASLGVTAIAAATRGRTIRLLDARVVQTAGSARCIAGVLRNDGDVAVGALVIDVLLLDRHGNPLAQSRCRIAPLPAHACCAVRSLSLPPTAARFRFQHAAPSATDDIGAQRLQGIARDAFAETAHRWCRAGAVQAARDS